MKEKAAKLVASGQFERAEVLLRQALTQSPRDVQTWLRHAEVLKRLSRNPDAVASYRLAARILDEEGHHPRAVAALKLALSLVPDDVDLIADIIRSEMRARRQGNDVRALFPLSSPSQLLSGASTESGLFQSSGSMVDVEEPQLSLPMSTPSGPPSADEARAENAAARSDAWVPEPSAPNAEKATSAAPPSPLPPPEGDPSLQEVPLASTVGESSPIPLVSEVAPMASTLGSAGASLPLPAPPPSSPVRFEVEASAQWPQVRRLSDQRIAVQAAEGARWVVLESSSAIAVRFADELEVPDDAEWLE